MAALANTSVYLFKSNNRGGSNKFTTIHLMLANGSLSFILFSLSVLSFDVLVILVLNLVELLHVLEEVFTPFERDEQLGSLNETRLIVIALCILVLLLVAS